MLESQIFNQAANEHRKPNPSHGARGVGCGIADGMEHPPHKVTANENQKHSDRKANRHKLYAEPVGVSGLALHTL